MSELDLTRHMEVFDPAKTIGMRIDVIGDGAVGSRIVRELARLGVQDIHVWDFDIIEAHNVPNQDFGLGDIGQKKVDASAERILRDQGLKITTHDERVDGSQPMGNFVFLAVDKMRARKEIFDKGLIFRPHIRGVCELRMGPVSGRIYTFVPSRPSHISAWQKTISYTDEEAQVSACGSTTTVGATAGLIAVLAVWKFIAVMTEKPYDNYVLVQANPSSFYSEQWD